MQAKVGTAVEDNGTIAAVGTLKYSAAVLLQQSDGCKLIWTHVVRQCFRFYLQLSVERAYALFDVLVPSEACRG
eukprot:751807-Hanusia_phi.AAC.3